MLKAAIIGIGYWGKNLLRVLHNTNNLNLVLGCDLNEKNLEAVRGVYPDIEFTLRMEEIFNNKDIDMVVIATPAVSHAEVARQALLSGKHVFVEKPMSLKVSEAQDLLNLSRKFGLKLMVGHLLLYHPAVLFLKKIITKGELGSLYYIYSQRLNLGQIRQDENAMWSLAPHDISVILYLFGVEPLTVSVFGRTYIQKEIDIEDVIFLSLVFPDNRIAHIQLSWLDPHKVRRITIVGDRKMAEFDDMEPQDKVKIYDKGVQKGNLTLSNSKQSPITLRSGEVFIPKIEKVEPLAEECAHFVDCILHNRRPRSAGEEGLAVVKILQAAHESLKKGGGAIKI